MKSRKNDSAPQFVPEKIPVKILHPAGALHPNGDRLLLRGDVVEFPTDKAEAMVRAGRASGFTLVRALRDNMTLGIGLSRICSKGETDWLFPDLARKSVEAGSGVIEIVWEPPPADPCD